MTKIVKISSDDPNFIINDGIRLAQRSAISLSKDMPSELRYMVRDWYNKGWITVDAYMLESELMWGKLSERAEVKHEIIS